MAETEAGPYQPRLAVLSGSGPEAEYLAHLRQGRFMLQRSASSGEHYYYPRAFTTGAASADLVWVEVSGKGSVYSTTIVRRKAEHGGDYNVSIVELAEGPRMLTRVLGVDPGAVKIGMAVEARIELPAWNPKSDQPLVVFYPASRQA